MGAPQSTDDAGSDCEKERPEAVSSGGFEHILEAFRNAGRSADETVPFDEIVATLKLLSPAHFDDETVQLLSDAVKPNEDGNVEYQRFLAWVCESQAAEEAKPVVPNDHRDDSPSKRCADMLYTIRQDAITLPYEVQDGVAVISLGDGADGETLPWGTKTAEHRLYPANVMALFSALDKAEKDAEVQAVVVTASGRYWSNGFDLKWIQQHADHADMLQQATELLCARILKYSKPTIAAVNGHATAAGAMLLLSFDVKVMNIERGFCFVPGVDLDLVYSPGMSALMMAKLPFAIRHDFIVFGTRHTGRTLLSHGAIDAAVPPDEVLSEATRRAMELRPKAKHAAAMARIKETLYHEAIAALEYAHDEVLLHPHFTPMGFEAVAPGTDRPAETRGARKRDILAKSQAQAMEDLKRLSLDNTASDVEKLKRTASGRL